MMHDRGNNPFPIHRRPVTHDEYQALLRAAGDGEFRRLLVFLWETGMRPGEVRKLRWVHVNFEKKMLSLPTHKARKITRKPHLVPLNSVALRLLAYLHRQTADHNSYAFLNSQGRPWSECTLSMRMIRCRTQAGVGQSAHLHGMRHAYAHRLIMAGLPARRSKHDDNQPDQ